jgi:hypothetical protein
VITKFDPQKCTKGHKGHKGHKGPLGTSKLYTKPYLAIPFQNHTLYSRKDPRLLVTASLAIMIVVHSA